jgi:hypothetical protein
MFNKTVIYGIRCLKVMADNGFGNYMPAVQIAARASVPEAYGQQILKTLALPRNGVIVTRKGKGGGCCIADGSIPLSQALVALGVVSLSHMEISPAYDAWWARVTELTEATQTLTLADLTSPARVKV